MSPKATDGTRMERVRTLANQSRQVLLEMIYHAKSGHVGSSLSCMDILSVLKFDQMNWDGSTPRTESDVFVLSKGHAVPAWYAALVVSGEPACRTVRERPYCSRAALVGSACADRHGTALDDVGNRLAVPVRQYRADL